MVCYLPECLIESDVLSINCELIEDDKEQNTSEGQEMQIPT